MLSAHVPAEFEIVGKNQVRQCGEIPLHLVGPLDFIKRLAHVLGFNVAKRYRSMRRVAGNHIVGSAAFNPLGLIGCGHSRYKGFNQRLERRAVGVLSRVACLKLSLNLAAVCTNRS